MTRGEAPERTGAEILLEALAREGVDTIFGYPGGANLPIYQHLPEFPNLKHVLVRHEQGAAHMADGYSRASRRVGVCFATSGPGALNLTTGLASEFMDSVPLVAITSQAPTAMVGRAAFQDSDVIGVSMPMTKHNYLVTRRCRKSVSSKASRWAPPYWASARSRSSSSWPCTSPGSWAPAGPSMP